MSSYEEIFNERGKSYHMAMEKYPNARDQEFKATVDHLDIKNGMTLLDIPAGGGYLSRFLTNINYLAYDFSGEFEDGHHDIRKCKESKIDLKTNSVDWVVSLAALHHITERSSFYLEMNRVLKNKGQMIIADVNEGTAIADFLNGFVDEWNSMGHRGKFICDNDQDEIINSGFQVEKKKEEYLWTFEDLDSAKDFFRLLFRLDLQPPDDLLEKAVIDLGVVEKEGLLGIKWGLSYLLCSKS
ncbi:class I SAM-dependent methyltransferase [Ekhidna sp.]|uniref:class I SAM-dependent methyltransferase n=1 Tax=Ekhidna sp. TaxID=2608089 RepID=UPI003B514D2F